MSRVVIIQPAYLPWLGYFNRLSQADTVVFLDHVSMDHGSKTRFVNRNRIRHRDEYQWLTVPVRGHRDTPINQLVIADQAFRIEHVRKLREAYRDAPFYKQMIDFVAPLIEQMESGDSLTYLIHAFTITLMEKFGMNPVFDCSSYRAYQEKKGDLILRICQDHKATAYISGPFGKDYLDKTKFEEAGIALEFAEYQCPTYPQNGKVFIPNLSIVDTMANLPMDEVRKLIYEPKR